MEKTVLITRQTEKAVCVGDATWIARSHIESLKELDTRSVDQGNGRVGIWHVIRVTPVAAQRAGW